jgi:hypothetical protein
MATSLYFLLSTLEVPYCNPLNGFFTVRNRRPTGTPSGVDLPLPLTGSTSGPGPSHLQGKPAWPLRCRPAPKGHPALS